jgi:hypothetical protein
MFSGALDLLAQVGRERRQVGRQRGRRRGAAGDLVARDVPRLRDVLTRLGSDPLLGGRDELHPGGHQLVDQAHLQGLLRPDPLALQQQLQQRVDDAEHPHGSSDAAGAGQQTELDLREAELDLGVVEGDTVVAGQADLQAAAEGGAVDGGHDRLAEHLQPAQDGLVLTHPDGDLLGVVGLGGLEIVEVATGEERLLGRRDHHAGDLVALGLEPVDGCLDRLAVGGVHRVRRLVGVVEGQDHDAVVVLVPADGVGVGAAHLRHAPPRWRCPCRRRRTAWPGRSACPDARARRPACRGSSRRWRPADGPWRSLRR